MLSCYLITLWIWFFGESYGYGGSGGPGESDDSGEFSDTDDTADSGESFYSIDLGECCGYGQSGWHY